MSNSLSLSDDARSSTSSRVKNLVFTAAVAAAFAFGLYSLFMAYANADKLLPLDTSGVLRTATGADSDKLGRAMGDLREQDLVFVVLDESDVGPEPYVEVAARRAARALADSGMAVSVRLLGPGDADFTPVVTHNGVSRFPAVLMVKKGRGIVLLTSELDEENLLKTYHEIWGKTSSCQEAKSAVY